MKEARVFHRCILSSYVIQIQLLYSFHSISSNANLLNPVDPKSPKSKQNQNITKNLQQVNENSCWTWKSKRLLKIYTYLKWLRNINTMKIYKTSYTNIKLSFSRVYFCSLLLTPIGLYCVLSLVSNKPCRLFSQMGYADN